MIRHSFNDNLVVAYESYLSALIHPAVQVPMITLGRLPESPKTVRQFVEINPSIPRDLLTICSVLDGFHVDTKYGTTQFIPRMYFDGLLKTAPKQISPKPLFQMPAEDYWWLAFDSSEGYRLYVGCTTGRVVVCSEYYEKTFVMKSLHHFFRMIVELSFFGKIKYSQSRGELSLNLDEVSKYLLRDEIRFFDFDGNATSQVECASLPWFTTGI